MVIVLAMVYIKILIMILTALGHLYRNLKTHPSTMS